MPHNSKQSFLSRRSEEIEDVGNSYSKWGKNTVLTPADTMQCWKEDHERPVSITVT